ncbi:MAG: ABC transporter substrate-binding protein [Nostoc sp. LLA-1]|nr:ABC transporter substrate-binding protein [Cyanocohniella sp. LLY]
MNISTPYLPKLSTLATLFLLLLNTACSSQAVSNPNQETTQITSTLRLGIISTTRSQVPTGPAGWAIHRNKFLPELEKVGITDVKISSFPNGPNLNEALVSGSIDVGIYGDTPALVARSQEIPTRLISQEQVGMNAWLLVKENGPRTVADLKGQKVATARGSYMHRYLMGLLQKHNVADQVSVVHLLTSDAEAALERGDVAAIVASVGAGPLLQKKGYVAIDEARNHPDLPGTSVAVATETFLTKHPDLPQKWNRIKQAAVKDIQANTEAYYQFHAEVSGYPLDVVKISYPIQQFPQEPVPAQGKQLLEGTKQFLVSQNLAKTDFQLTDWIVP